MSKQFPPTRCGRTPQIELLETRRLFAATYYVSPTGNDAADGQSWATALASPPGNVVTLSYRRNGFFRLKARNEERIHRFAEEAKVRVIFNSSVQRVGADAVIIACGGDDGGETLTLRNDYVFVCAGGEPPYPFLRGIGVRFNGDDQPARAHEQDLVEAS